MQRNDTESKLAASLEDAGQDVYHHNDTKTDNDDGMDRMDTEQISSQITSQNTESAFAKNTMINGLMASVDIKGTEFDDDLRETLSVSRINRERKVKNKLRIVVNDATKKELEVIEERARRASEALPVEESIASKKVNLRTNTGNTLSPGKETPKEVNTDGLNEQSTAFTFGGTMISTIIIDEIGIDAESINKDFEISEIQLPKVPICALILMDSLGIYSKLDRGIRWSVFGSILITIMIQLVAVIALFRDVLFERIEINSYNFWQGTINVSVLSFVIIYLARDSAGVYKTWVLLNWMQKAKKMNRKVLRGVLYLFLVSNILCYLVLLYYAMSSMNSRDKIGNKLEIAISIFFILEVDDWLYAVTIEPLKILDDSIFTLQIKGKVHSRMTRYKKATYWFWSLFIVILSIQIILFSTRAVNVLTIDD